MDEWYKTRGGIGIVLGLVFFVAGFIWMWCFFQFELFSPSNRLSIWLGAVIAGLLFFTGFCVSFKVQLKKSVMFALIFLGYSLVFLSVPSGYEEVYYGGFAILIMAILVLYAKLKKSEKKNQKHMDSSKCGDDMYDS